MLLSYGFQVLVFLLSEVLVPEKRIDLSVDVNVLSKFVRLRANWVIQVLVRHLINGHQEIGLLAALHVVDIKAGLALLHDLLLGRQLALPPERLSAIVVGSDCPALHVLFGGIQGTHKQVVFVGVLVVVQLA